MLDLGRQGRLQVPVEHVQSLPGQTVHKVDTDIADAGIAAYSYRFKGLSSGVTAMHESEQSVVECLDTHADTVHANRFKGAHILRGDVIGITLYSEFLETLQAQS